MNAGDYDAIQEQFRVSLGDPTYADEFWRVMIDGRNADWMPGLRRYLDEGRAVILVGAMHLPGPNGLIKRLQLAGYRVEPVLLPALLNPAAIE